MEKQLQKPSCVMAGIALLISLFAFRSNAQILLDTSMHQNVMNCGSDLDYFIKGAGYAGIGGTYTGFTPSTPFSDSAIFSCGLIDVYYEDVNSHLHTGFDDTTHVGGTTLGAIRRNTYCSVLNYVQSVIDFSNVSDTAHIRLYMDVSIAAGSNPAYAFYPPIQFAARSYPQYDTTYAGIKNGWMNDYITRPSWHLHDSLPSSLFHGRLQCNFDKTYLIGIGGLPIDSTILDWQSDASIPFTRSTSCGQADLYTALLHETTHCLGWFSLIGFRNSGGAGLTPFAGILTNPNIFTGIDWSVCVSNNTWPLSLTKVLSGSGSLPVLDSSNPIFQSNNNYWINDSAAPNNYPVYSRGSSHSFISHLDDQPFNYTLRERVSPGDQQDYVMGPFTLGGVLRRQYSKGEIHTLETALGYTLRTGYVSANPIVCFNHKPYSKKMAQMGITLANYAYFTETVTPDDTLTNNVGVSRVEASISSMIASGDLSDSDPGDISHLYIDSTTLVNFRGCGIGGNNHASLIVSADSKTITYHPRANFYGRANFGFNITDGKERGSFIVVTIDVKKGNNVSCALGANMICNSGFEEGSEVKLDTISETIPNSVLTENMWHEGKWQGISFSDSHPYCFTSDLNGYQCGPSSGTIVEGSHYGWIYGTGLFTTCGIMDTSTSEAGNYWLSCPTPSFWAPSATFTFDNPLPEALGGKRYQEFSTPGSSYYNLLDSVKHCHKYTLEFDLYKQVMIRDSFLHFTIGFADHTVNLDSALADTSLNFTFNDSMVTTYDSWTHFSIPFHYCGTNPSNLLYLSSTHPGNPFGNFLIDNLSLKEDTTANPPLLVSITDTLLTGCHSKLTALVTNAFCTPGYIWNASIGTVLTSQSDTVLTNVPFTYSVTVNDGCRAASAIYSVTETNPSAISGPATVCVGATTTLSDIPGGGTWISSNPAIATIGSATGIVTGVMAGIVTITYTTICHSTKMITVNPLPAAIAGSLSVCVGYTTPLIDPTTGGSWSSSNIAIATVGSSTGIVTGIASGTAMITYTIPTGCYVTAMVTVNITPYAISGTASICPGSTNYLADVPGSGTWTSSNTSVATIGSSTGLLTGIAAGNTTITYMLSTGCFATIIATVNPLPGAISGITPICIGSTETFTDPTTGGSWSSSNTSVATIGSSTGILTGLSTGTTTIKYTSSAGCFISFSLSVNSAPASITGGTSLCVGSSETLSDATPGGLWSSSNALIATVGSITGILTGVSTGVDTVTYTVSSGCKATISITVNPLPSVITGITSICAGTSTTLMDATTGGTWSSSNTSVATIGSTTGIFMGVTAGTATITYLLSTGCNATITVTVKANPLPIAGTSNLCTGAYYSFTDGTLGGTWSSSNSSVASIGTGTGIVSGISSGTATITYLISTGCIATFPVTVSPSPASITGPSVFCSAISGTLSDGTGGGLWISSNPSVAIIGSGTGIVTGIVAGTSIISYILPSGCYALKPITVNASPSSITGSLIVCVGGVTTLSDAVTGGIWSSTAPAVASVGSGSGVVIGVSLGTATISYTLPGGCSVSVIVTVHPAPAAITGILHICPGQTTILSDATTGGIWSISPVSFATIGSGTGIVTGIANGISTVLYTISVGCIATASFTVNPLPATITGGTSVCIGSTILQSDITSGGTWSSGSPAIGSISTTGVVTGLSSGTTTITYMLPTGCYATTVVTVNPIPAAIAGSGSICPGTTLTLTDATAGGLWYSTNNSIATVGSSSGIVTGVSLGTVVVDYLLPSGCFVADTLIVGGGSDPCSPCYGLPEGYTTIGATGPVVITSNIGPGHYYLANNATISGNINIDSAIIEIAPGVTIYVLGTSFLTINGSHLFGTCQMWNGIVLLNDHFVHSGRLYIVNGSLIEDALDAVYIFHPITPPGGLYVFKSDNAIFNRNITSIDIEYYNSPSTSYPFLIRNTVVTGRDFRAVMPGSYPDSWPTTTGLGGLKTYYNPGNVFMPPFNIDNPAAAGGLPYTGVACKNGVWPFAAIKLDSVGSNVLNPALTSFYHINFPATYSDIVIGDTTTTEQNQYQNLFDHSMFGIYAINSNVTSVNNAFIYFYSVGPLYPGGYSGGDCIYSGTTDDNANQNRLRVYSPNGNTYHNLFYEFRNGIECSNTFQIIGRDNYMINKNSVISVGGPYPPPPNLYGWYGYNIQTSKYDTISIVNDTLTNLNTGISIWENGDPMTSTHPISNFCGYGWIMGNLIQANPAGYSPGMTQFIGTGIAIQNSLTSTLGTSFMTSMTVRGNYLQNVFNGIYLNNMWQNAQSVYNTITILPNTGTPPPMQYGINNTKCLSSYIYDNKVTGVLPTEINNDSIKAFYSASNFGTTTMACNIESNVGRGFEFFLNNYGMTWYNNQMSKNYKGMVLNAAVIGTQYPLGAYPMGDLWYGSWGGTLAQTYVYHGANASSSPFYVNSGAFTSPTVNTGTLGFTTWYIPGTNIYTVTSTPEICHDLVRRADSTYDKIAQQQIVYNINVIPNNWMGQYALWNLILSDSTLVDSSAALAEFALLAANSRYAYITNMEALLFAGNFDSVTTMLGYNIDSMANTSFDTTTQVMMADSTAADNIVQNYQIFFNLYMKYITASLSSSDSIGIFALAQLCPERNGTVVFQARALYSQIFNDLSMFNDDYCLDIDSTYVAGRHSNPGSTVQQTEGEQRYWIHPNPNDGNFVIQQYLPDNELVKMKIYDAIGRSVYSSELEFAKTKSQINLNNYVPGIYLIEITDSKNRIFRLKFVINK